MKEIIVYYSLNGHVRQIVDHMQGTKIEVKTVKKMSKNKVWQMIVLGYLVIKNKRLEINKLTSYDIETYDIIHFVAPIWAGKIALPMQSFIEQNPFKNKKVKLTVSCNGGAKNAKNDFIQLLDTSNELISFEVVISK